MKLGFIGAGHMGGALLDACAKKVSGTDIAVADPNPARTAHFAEAYGCIPMTAAEAAAFADMLFIGVKPQMAEEAFASFRPALQERAEKPVLVSMMAGQTMERVRNLCGTACPIIRIMPNVAASVGEAMILCASLGATEEQTAAFQTVLSEAGRLDFIPEKLIDAGTAVQGCGPAYVCLFVEALADGAVKCGIPRAKAMEYAIQTLKGTAVLLAQSGQHPGVVKDAVTSPAGSTIEGVEALEENGFRYAVMQAVVRAYEKNTALR